MGLDQHETHGHASSTGTFNATATSQRTATAVLPHGATERSSSTVRRRLRPFVSRRDFEDEGRSSHNPIVERADCCVRVPSGSFVLLEVSQA